MRNAPVIYIVVPCYNEEEVLPLTAEFLGKKLDDLTRSRRIHPGSRVLMVDDGSKDRTWKLIEELHEKDERFAGVKLSRGIWLAVTSCTVCAVTGRRIHFLSVQLRWDFIRL